MTISEILKEGLESFDERYKDSSIDFIYKGDRDNVKSFIQDLTKRIIESEIERTNQLRIIPQVRKLTAEEKLMQAIFNKPHLITKDEADIYNKALQDIISHLESELKSINEN